MEIVSLQLSGFKNYEVNTQLDFIDQNNQLIFDTDSEKKILIFEAILGIMFGFNNQEKARHRGDQEKNKTFTGLITLKLDERTMIIERDFETDFVACLLSDTKHTRPIFQGKDYVEGNYTRPYLHMLKSIFPIIDKELFFDVCYDFASSPSHRLSDLLESLYLLLTPHFKFSSCRELVQQAEIMMNTLSSEKAVPDSMQDIMQSMERQRRGLEFVIKIQQLSDRLNGDVEKLNLLMEKIRKKKHHLFSTQSNVNEKFSLLQPFNPLQLRADILLWKSLQSIKEKNEESLNQLNQKRRKIENILNRDLAEYSRLPESFSKEMANYKKMMAQLSKHKHTLQANQTEISTIRHKLNTWKKIGLLLLIILFPAIFGVSYYLFEPMWSLIIPESIFIFLMIAALLGHISNKYRTRIYSAEEELHLVQKKIHDMEQEIKTIRSKFHLMEIPEHLDAHLERFKKYKQLQAEVKRIEKEKGRITSLLTSDSYTRRLPDYRRRYSQIIDINRPDLENFLDEFVAAKDEISRLEAAISTQPAPEEILELSRRYSRSIAELKSSQNHIMEALHLEGGYGDLIEALDQIDRKIKNAQLQQRMSYAYLSKN